MPAARVMTGRDGVADPALDFGAQDERVQHRRPGQAALFRKREHGRGDRRGRMDDRAQMGVVVVEQVPADRVDECGAEQIEPFRAAKHGHPFGAGQRRQNPHGHSIGGVWATPRAQPMKFSSDRLASCRTAGGSASHRDAATNLQSR